MSQTSTATSGNCTCGCGCCASGGGLPAALYNRPGLPALSYRISTYPDFLARMLAGIATQQNPADTDTGDPASSLPAGSVAVTPPPLAGLTTRSPDDFSIALLDAWAVVCDVLTFYQERVANEGYLRTATERQSVLQLAREIGYELSPGVAASTYLAFNASSASGPATTALVPQGTKVQSVPGPGQTPQTFETSSDATLYAMWNSLPARQTRPQELAVGSDGNLYELGVSVQLNIGDATTTVGGLNTSSGLTFYPLFSTPPVTPTAQVISVSRIYLTGTNNNIKRGDLLLFVGQVPPSGPTSTAICTVQAVTVDTTNRQTIVDLAGLVKPPPANLISTFNPNEIDFVSHRLPVGVIDLKSAPLTETAINTGIIQKSWTESDLAAQASIQGWDAKELITSINAGILKLESPPQPQLPLTVVPGVYAFNTRAAAFGHNAPAYATLPASLTKGTPAVAARNGKAAIDAIPPVYTINWDANPPPLTIGQTSAGSFLPQGSSTFYLDRPTPDAVTGTWVVLTGAGAPTAYQVNRSFDISAADFAISATVTGVTVQSPNLAAVDFSLFPLRQTTIFTGSQLLNLIDLPIAYNVAAGSTSLELDEMTIELAIGAPVILSGENDDLPGVDVAEPLILSGVNQSGGLTTLAFQTPLQYSYNRSTATINANVVAATHGQTVGQQVTSSALAQLTAGLSAAQALGLPTAITAGGAPVEVLGSGDATIANQTFTLSKPPLTYVSANSPTGLATTLTVRVDGVAWTEVPQLYGLGPTDRSYIVRMDNDGTTRIIFGDGVTGARVTTGQNNVTASYRSGIGLAGMVGAGQLSILMDRPLSVDSVTNPDAASGAADPENLDSARGNAPLQVLTLGRIVSISDLENFAAAFPGIGKAQAVAVWTGVSRIAHLTIASAAPAPATAGQIVTNVVTPDMALFSKCKGAINTSCDPQMALTIDSYQPLFFNLTVQLLVDSTYVKSDVWAAVELALIDGFSFAAREFAQPVTTAQITAIVQGIAGVIASDITALYQVGNQPAIPVPALLAAAQAVWDPVGRQITQAQLLLINPGGITPQDMTP